MKKLVLASVALIASTVFAAAAVDVIDLHSPPDVVVEAVAEAPSPDAVVEVDAMEIEQMMIGHVEGATRVIGKSQGYLGLPIRDELVSCSVNGTETPAMVTAWHPTPDELQALINGAPVYVQLLGQQHPPIAVGTGPEPTPV